MPRDIDGSTVVDCIDFAISLILSRSPQLRVADSLRRLHIVERHYCRDSLDALRRTSWIPCWPRTIRVPRVTSAPLGTAFDAFLWTCNAHRDPVPRSVVTRFATQRITSRGVLRRRPVALGRAVSRGSGFPEDADYCLARIARWIYARPANSRKRGSWKRGPCIVARSRNAAWDAEVRARCFSSCWCRDAIGERKMITFSETSFVLIIVL